jgi:uncharacterized membrane protein HdeD (DUF308 family)
MAADPIPASASVPWWLLLIQGIAAVILGVLLLAAPAATLVLMIQLLGAYWLVGGVFSLVSMFVDRTNWGWKLLGGIVAILAGLAVLQHPSGAAWLSRRRRCTCSGSPGW